MAEDAPSWVAFVERIRSGDRSAEADLVAVFQPRVHCIALARTRDGEVSKELTQEVILRTIHALRNGQLREPVKLPAFVHGILRNVLAAQRRAAARADHDRLPEDDEAPLVAASAEPDARLPLLREALASLSAADRNILLMLLVDGLTSAMVASRLNLTQEAVRQRKSRAIRRVREAIRERAAKRPAS